MNFRNAALAAALLPAWLILVAPVRADYIFTSNPTQGHVYQLDFGLSQSPGDGARQANLTDPSQPAFSFAGANGLSFITVGVTIDGTSLAPDAGTDLQKGNPVSYAFSFGNQAAILNIQGMTSQGGQIVPSPTFDSFIHSVPGFGNVVTSPFFIDGIGLTGSLDLTVAEQKVTWAGVTSTDPTGGNGGGTLLTPEPGSAFLLAIGAVGLLAARRHRRAA